MNLPLLKSLPAACVVAMALAAPVLADATTPVSTADAVAGAAWSENVTITLGDGSFRYQSDGLPDHELPESYVVPKTPGASPFSNLPDSDFEIMKTSEWLQASPIDVTIPTVPVYSESPTPTPLGIIGVMVSGARMFNDYEDHARQNAAVDDNKVIGDAKFLDDCTAHPLASGNDYHYHGVPYCITDKTDHAHEHSAMIGVLMDGFPIYGQQGADGTLMTNETLDACSGHFEATPEFPQGIYHYHLTSDRTPYSIDCLHGVVDQAQMAADGPQGGPGGQGPDFAAIAAELGVNQDTLMEALGQQGPPDLDAAAAKLGISVDALRDAMGPPPAN